ncbi:hypothetical protein VTJ83DRAFT_5283 [Remersonia thermophila]|uniref:Uncharacterized protein n=1 Tax=Remersonia thermophila TaxID=72144 RepID=A0ABR4D6D9_9PEZI
MAVDAAELRRRWSDKTNAVFSARDRYEYQEYPAANFEREFDFGDCGDIVFMRGERMGTGEDVILLAKGSGHMTLPAGVQVVVRAGYAKWAPAGSAAPPLSPPRDAKTFNRTATTDAGDWKVVEESPLYSRN